MIYLAFDLDYTEDYKYLPEIYKVLNGVPCTLFIVGSKHPAEKQEFPDNIQIGNHTFDHQEWYGLPLKERIDDLEKNHEFIKNMYGIECKVYRSPHLRNFPDTAQEMQLRGYKPEMECAECPFCNPISETLRVYFSSHHHFGPNSCGRDFLEMFQTLCEEDENFTFFLDPHHFDTKERLTTLKNLINIGNNYGEFALL